MSQFVEYGQFKGATNQANGESGVVPAPSAGDEGKYLKGDGSWGTLTLPSDMTGASSSAAGAHGLVPAPAQGDQGKFLKGDGSWDNVPDPQDFTGATSNANGTHGLVPAPSAGDQLKVLAGDGTWMVSPGSKAYEISGTVTNVSGVYSGTFNDDKVTADMKPMEIEIGTPSVFRGAINVQCYAGYITVACSEVVGTSTIKVTVQKVIQDPTTMTSTEFDILNNRLLAVENVYVDRNISIAVSDWELESGEYVYVWESSLVTTDCGITVYPLDGIENAQVENWGAEKVTGGVEIVVPTLPVAAVPLKIRIINTKASQLVNLSGDDISTEAVTGADTVEEALEILDGKLGDVPSGTDVQTEISTLSSKITPSYEALSLSNSFVGSGDVHIYRIGEIRILTGSIKPTNAGANQVALTLQTSDRPSFNINAPASGYTINTYAEMEIKSSSGNVIISVTGTPNNSAKFNITYAV